MYSARVHRTIASYHSQLKSLYEYASHQQTEKANDVGTIGIIDTRYLKEYANLGTYHSSIADQHQARANAVVIDDGSESSNPALYGLAKAAVRQKRLIDRHADISNKRRRLNVALFAPLQHLNNASLEKHTQLGTPLASHFADNKMMGRSDRERFKQLERLYRDRLAVLEIEETEDEDLFASDTERKALYQYLADINTELGEMYTNMSDQSYWDGMFSGFADSLNDKSTVYKQLAWNHNQIAANNELLASKSSEKYDHTVLGNDDTILRDTYTWDDIGNLVSREHGAADLNEEFEYDALNRLTRSGISGGSAMMYQLTGNDVVTYQYNALGNITFKSDIGFYDYGINAGPHAVTAINGDINAGQKNTSYQYDANGNMTIGDGRLIQYTSFNKPNKVQGDGDTSGFIYGPERQLVKQVEQTGTVPKSTLYIGSQYQKIYDGYETTEKYHISTHNGATIAVIIDKQDDTPKTHYLHRDHLDSIVAITNEQGYVVERFFYDAFGKQLTAINPDGNALYINTLDTGLTDRGFTGHRIIQSGLIHMGGRVYDPAIGRFLSADPHIQFAGNLQNYNRYSYVNNNPLAFNDPSGYFLSKIFKKLKRLFKKLKRIIKKVLKVIKKVVKFIKENLKMVIAIVVAVAVAIYAPYLLSSLAGMTTGTAAAGTLALTTTGIVTAGAIAGGLSGLITTGSIKGMLKGAVMGALTGAVGAGFKEGGTLAKAFGSAKRLGQVITHGVVGGIRTDWNGGSFSKGLLTGAVGKMTTFATMTIENSFTHGLAVATAGGAVSVLAGGSFEMGFIAAGMGFATNHMLTDGAAGVKNWGKRTWGKIKWFAKGIRIGGGFGLKGFLSIDAGSTRPFDPSYYNEEGFLEIERGFNVVGFEMTARTDIIEVQDMGIREYLFPEKSTFENRHSISDTGGLSLNADVGIQFIIGWENPDGVNIEYMSGAQ